MASLLLVNCGKDSYKIKGEIPGLEDGTMVRLSALDYDGLVDLDSTTVKDCKFTFKGKTDTAQVAVITFDFGESMRGCQLFLERGEIIVMVDLEKNNQLDIKDNERINLKNETVKFESCRRWRCQRVLRPDG